MPLPSLSELTENFSLFDDWEDKYQYLIDLGKQLDPMDEALKTPGTEVRGCLAKVWLVTTRLPDGRLHFHADSNADITRGLIAVLMVVYQDKTPAEIAAIDIDKTFEVIQLVEQVSPNRRNGFYAMVKTIQALGQLQV